MFSCPYSKKLPLSWKIPGCALALQEHLTKNLLERKYFVRVFPLKGDSSSSALNSSISCDMNNTKMFDLKKSQGVQF